MKKMMNNHLTFQELVERDIQILRSRQPIFVSSGFTPETLKQALDEAKEVRAQALRNAKAALEEAFGERFEELLVKELKTYG